MSAVQTQGSPPIAPFPPLDESPVASRLGAAHGSIPRPLCICDAGARGKAAIGGGTRPPLSASRSRRSDDSLPLAPASRPGGGAIAPRLRRRFGCAHRAPTRPRWGAVAAWNAARAWLPQPVPVVCGQTSDARDCATPVAYPTVMLRWFPGYRCTLKSRNRVGLRRREQAGKICLPHLEQISMVPRSPATFLSKLLV